jgi:prepilin-type N-terminal cleavage/methylation domain-containing protein/prepilin-type processing-associated H-X9-DG protein
MHGRFRGAFSLIELLVVIGVIGVLLAITLPVMEKVRHRGYISACAANLRSIGQALEVYANENRGNLPRTNYVPGAAPTAGTGAASPDPFALAGPAPNDVSAALFLLARTQRLPYKIFICPYNDVFVYEADRGGDALSRSNFTDAKKNLGYSLANPYPDDAAVRAGYQFTTKLGASVAIAADKNPGTAGRDDDATAAAPGAPWRIMMRANSANHEKDGQNVLYGDGHVAWQTSALTGAHGDNIYTNGNNQVVASPMGREDSVLLPTDD